MSNQLQLIRKIAQEVRAALEARYPLPLYGRCIEATEILVGKLSEIGLETSIREGWCLFEDEHYGTSRPYDEHTWCEVRLPDSEAVFVIDVTLDQFEGGFFEELPSVYVGPKPEFLQYEEPEMDHDEYDETDFYPSSDRHP